MNFELKGPDGGITGPFEEKVIVDWIRNGELPREAELREVGTENWTPAEMMGDFRPLFDEGKKAGGSKMIPTRNPAAMMAYYSSLVSCLPLIGLPVAVFSLFQAVKGWKAYQENPEVHGKGHVITAFVCCGISLLINLPMVFLILANLGSA